MQRRNRSPGLILAMFALGVLSIVSAPLAGVPPGGGGSATAEQGPMHHLSSASGRAGVEASFSKGSAPEPTCRKGQAILGISANFVTRGSLKVLTGTCQDCCAENIVFIDDFEIGNTTGWSNTVGG